MAKHKIGDVFRCKFSKRNYFIADIRGDDNATPSLGPIYFLYTVKGEGPPSIQHSIAATDKTLSDHYEIVTK